MIETQYKVRKGDAISPCCPAGKGRRRGPKKVAMGYKSVHKPDHPNCSISGHVQEHRLVFEGANGRLLDKKEVIHHIDGNTYNNNIDNLMVFKNRAAHILHHHQLRIDAELMQTAQLLHGRY